VDTIIGRGIAFFCLDRRVGLGNELATAIAMAATMGAHRMLVAARETNAVVGPSWRICSAASAPSTARNMDTEAPLPLEVERA